MMTHKTCTQCNNTLPAEAFRTRTKRRPGRRDCRYLESWCLRCAQARANRYYAEKLKGKPRFTAEDRRAWREREWKAKGKQPPLYKPVWYQRLEQMGRGYGLACRGRKRKRLTAREQWVSRLKRECPELYVKGMSVDALCYRARYHLDPVFRERETARALRRKSYGCLDDGSLSSQIVQSLFARATHCLYCGSEMHTTDKTMDHVMPRSAGGWHSKNNVVICCKRCNAAKAARLPRDWLRRVPTERRDLVRAHWTKIGALNEQPFLAA